MTSFGSSIKTVKNDDISERDMEHYIRGILRHEVHTPWKAQELRQYSLLLDEGFATIVKSTFGVESYNITNMNTLSEIGQKIKNFKIRLYFPSCIVDYPTTIDRNGTRIHTNPNDYRINEAFYSSVLNLTARVEVEAVGPDFSKKLDFDVNNIRVDGVPIMIGSSRCSTCNAPREVREAINEDPEDAGGYFILNGKEYVIQYSENMTYNKPLVFKSTLKTERVRCTIMSQAGGALYDSSSEITLIYMADNSIAVNIRATTIYERKIPFVTIFKMYGITSDRQIVEMIVQDMNTEQDQILSRIQSMAIDALKAKYSEQIPFTNTETVFHLFTRAGTLADPKAYRTEDTSCQHATNITMSKFDRYVLPHIGMDENARYNKALYLASLIRDMFLVHLNIRDEDDRDHVGTKRIYGASVAVSKTFKKIFNKQVYVQMYKIVKKTLEEKAFDTINTSDLEKSMRDAVSNDNLKKDFEKYILTATESKQRGLGKIRMNCLALERKNRLNVIVSQRTVVSNLSNVAKTTRRSDLARYWHSSAEGIYCPADSKENGPKVGLVKQLAITAIISEFDSNSRASLRDSVMAHKNIILLKDLILYKLSREQLTKIYVDGDWVGCCDDPKSFVDEYRLMRRKGEINRYISVEWNCADNVILFYTDFGRLMRPVLIVDGEMDQDGTYTQNIRLTRRHILGMMVNKISFEDLIKEGIVEYIYPGEEILLCPSIDRLRETRHDGTNRWTHCDVGATSFGINMLIGPLIDRNQPTRNTIITVQSKQACGQPFANVNTVVRRMQRFHMLRIHNPIVKTLSQHVVIPNGQNLIMTYAVFMGYNQEDSSVINKSSQELGMLKGTYYKMEKYELSKEDIIKVPTPSEVRSMKNGKSYAKLSEDGCVKIGDTLEKDDIWLGIVVESTEMRDGKKYIDKSEQWRSEGVGKVVSVIKKLEGSPKFVIITVEYERGISVGDKCTNRAGNKNVCGLLLPKCDMPVTLNGTRPDFVLNPGSIPSRMTMAQLFEIILHKVCVAKGVSVDASVYRSCDIYTLLEELEKLGLGVREKMIDGITGELQDAMIFTGPQVVFRLPKFVLDERQVTGRIGPLNPQTSQALTGKRQGGGAKVGEYDLWVLLAQGSMGYMHECFYLDSDYKKIFICRNCNEFAIYNPAYGKYRCNVCGDRADICIVDGSKTSTMIMHKMGCANIKLNLVPEARKFETLIH